MSEYIDLSPSPASLIESLRDIGYSLDAAIADIVDNSITANATQIHIRFAWNSGFSWLAIVDDGHGMSESELINAMRLGSTSPLENRTKSDLGRFGLGLKTASFSQSRQLTVLSKKGRQVFCSKWDLDFISEESNGKWQLLVLNLDTIQKQETLNLLYKEYLEYRENGTIVLWGKLDRLNEPNLPQLNEKHFNTIVYDARKHLELVFHRFLSPEPGNRKITISMNGDELDGFNPFNPYNLATQELEEQKILIQDKKILVQPYVLPHHSKVSRQEYEKYAGEGGYLHNQGFYVYRNRRLIIKGSWFHLIKKEELNKLIRVKVDIPNTLDYLWKLDIKKSFASPPASVRKELKQVIDRIEVAGRRVYGQKGKKLASEAENPVWERKAVGGTIIYQINREHPLLVAFLNKISAEHKKIFQDVITMFENSFPKDMFFNDFANIPEQMGQLSFDKDGLKKLLEIFITSLLDSGVTTADLPEKLLACEPFASNSGTTLELLRAWELTHENKA